MSARCLLTTKSDSVERIFKIKSYQCVVKNYLLDRFYLSHSIKRNKIIHETRMMCMEMEVFALIIHNKKVYRCGPLQYHTKIDKFIHNKR